MMASYDYERGWSHGFLAACTWWGAACVVVGVALMVFSGCTRYPCFGEQLGVNDQGSTICAEVPIYASNISTVQTLVGAQYAALYPDGPSPDSAWEGLDVQIINSRISTGCGWTDERIWRCAQHVAGVTYDYEKWVTIKHTPCLAHGALVHELLHGIQIWSMGITPASGSFGCVTHHRTPGFFQKGAIEAGLDPNDTIEFRANQELLQVLVGCENFR